MLHMKSGEGGVWVGRDMLFIKIVMMMVVLLELSYPDVVIRTSEVKYSCFITARCMWKRYETSSPALNRPLLISVARLSLGKVDDVILGFRIIHHPVYYFLNGI